MSNVQQPKACHIWTYHDNSTESTHTTMRLNNNNMSNVQQLKHVISGHTMTTALKVLILQ